MPSKPLRRVTLGLLVCIAALTASAADTEFNPVAREPRNASTAASVGVIFKLRADGAGASIAKLSTGSDRTQAIAKRTGLGMTLRREISAAMRRLEGMLAREQRLGKSPRVCGVH